ncbi:MAG: ferrochelatase [Candidatus Latescibacteria bacterium]|nr:ferrochelatase [Candidatus Latescibacterota bacterium]
MSDNTETYDAVLLLSFGGPEARDDVIPFLENVLRGRNVPHQRMLAVAEHYFEFDGVSPLNGQNRVLIAALEAELKRCDINLPVYWANRNWHPLLENTLIRMRDDGVRRALGFFTSAYSSYSGCRQYLENIEVARERVGEGVPVVEKLRFFYNHPGFVEPMAEHLREAMDRVPSERRTGTRVVFTAHSLPAQMASDCDYEAQLRETSALVSQVAGISNWDIVYQSRSGPPTQPWLGPDVGSHLEALHRDSAITDVVIAPIGFISDHMEVVYDLDVEARTLCNSIGLNMIRTATVGTHPRFVSMIRELIQERLNDDPVRLSLGSNGPSRDHCPADCCIGSRQRSA